MDSYPIFNPKLIGPNTIGGSPTVRRIPTEWYHKGKTHIGISGPRNTGKSVIVASGLIVPLCLMIPGLQVCVLRKEASTLYDTLIQAVFMQDVFVDGFNTRGFNFNRSRYELTFDNDSRIVFGGFGGSDAGGKVLGGKWDVAWYNQIERENDINNYAHIIGCMAEGRAGNLIDKDGNPTFLFIGDENPGSPNHWWYKKRFDADMLWYQLLHNDHPLFRDFKTGALNKRGENVRRQLKMAYPEGYMQDRMVDGIHAGAAGRVYPMITEENFREVQRSEIPPDWEWYCGMDYGEVDPDVYDAWAFKPDKTEAIFYKSIYRSGIRTDTFVDMIKALEQKENIRPIWRVSDHDKSKAKDMAAMGIENYPAIKNDIPSDLEHVKMKLQNMKITFNKNMLAHRPDQALINRNKFTDAMQEILDYCHKEEADQKGDGKDDYPAKDQCDHSMDVMKYIFRKVFPQLESFEVEVGKIEVPKHYNW